MNKDEFEGKWKQIRGQARQWWGKLTDDDLERVGGKYEQFLGVVQDTGVHGEAMLSTPPGAPATGFRPAGSPARRRSR